MNFKSSRLIALVLCMILVMTMIPVSSFASLSDTDNHWAGTVINEWVDKGLASGYPNGQFNPEGLITRAEFMSLVNKAFHYDGSMDASFSDVSDKDWYFDTVKTAISAGYITGYTNGTMKPNAPITRQEAAVIIARIMELGTDSKSSKAFTDQDKFAAWGSGFILAVFENGFMLGYSDNSFKPNEYIKRGEAITALNNAMQQTTVVFDAVGTFGPVTGSEVLKGDVIIKEDGVNLRNYTIKGDLTIAEGVGEGTVKLTNVNVEGSTYVRGGGKNSIHIIGGKYKKVIIEQTSSKQVRIVAIDAKGVEVVISEDAMGESVVLEGDFDSLSVEASQVDVIAKGNTKIKQVNVGVDIKGSSIDLDEKSTVDKMVFEGAFEVKGKGTISKAEVNANGVSFQTEPKDLIVNEKVKVMPIVGLSVESVPTAPTEGGGGGGTPAAKVVSTVGVTTNPIDVSALTFDQGPVLVALATSTESADIYYTLDGTLPTASSLLYNGPFSVNNSKASMGEVIVIKAIAIKTGFKDSTVSMKEVHYVSGTLAGTVSAYGLKFGDAIVGRETDIYVSYHSESKYEDGSVTFKLPEGFEATELDKLQLSSGCSLTGKPVQEGTEYNLNEITDFINLSSDGREVSVTHVNAGSDNELYVTLILKNCSNFIEGNYEFNAFGDRDGNGFANQSSGNGTEIYTLAANKKNMISGTVALPFGFIIEDDYLEVELKFINGNTSWSQYGYIPKGETTYSFQRLVPDGDYKLLITPNHALLLLGYYSDMANVTNEDAAYIISAYSDVDGINTVLETRTVLGTLNVSSEGSDSVLSGETHDLNIEYVAEGDYSFGTVTFELPSEFAVSGSDQIALSSGSRISGSSLTYSSSGSSYYTIEDLKTKAVVSNSGRTITIMGLMSIGNPQMRVVLNLMDRTFDQVGVYSFIGIGDQDGGGGLTHSNETLIGINTFEVVTSSSIEGVISLPPGELAPKGGYEVLVNVVGNEIVQKVYIIPEYENKMVYSLKVCPDNYTISFIDLSHPNSLWGHFNSVGCTVVASEAEVLDVSVDVKNIDLTLH